MKNFTKKIISLLMLLASINISAQEITPEMFITPPNTGANMTIGVAWASTWHADEDQIAKFQQFTGSQIGGFYDLDGDGTLECVGLEILNDSFTGLALWGDDSSTPEPDGLPSGGIPQFAILHDGNVILVQEIPQFTGYVSNGIVNFNDAILSAEGCFDENACNPSIIYEGVNYTGNCEYPETINLYGTEILLDCNGEMPQPINTGANMTIGVNVDILDQFEGGQIGAFTDLDGDGTLECVGAESISIGFFGLALWGDDSSTPELDGLPSGGIPQFYIFHDGNIIVMNEIPQFTGYVTNSIWSITDADLSIDQPGCSDSYACNLATNLYQHLIYTGQNTCEYPQQYYDCDGNCINDEDGDLVCDENEIPGCQDDGYTEFNPLATDDDGSCSITWEEGYNDASYQLDTMTSAYLTLLESPQCEEIIIDIEAGWNIFGYTSAQIVDIAGVMAPHDDKIVIMKDNVGDQYWPEYSFNGIGDFTPGAGYQIKASEPFSISFEN